jgi:hypothetical protein
MRTYVRMTHDLRRIALELAEQLYIDSGRGTPVRVPWNSPHLAGHVRDAWETRAHESLSALDRLGYRVVRNDEAPESSASLHSNEASAHPLVASLRYGASSVGVRSTLRR